MPVALKRKGSPSLEEDGDASKRRFTEVEVAPQTDATAEAPSTTPTEDAAPTDPTESASSAPEPAPTDRAARFAALRARNQASRKENLKDTKTEAKRLSTDPSQLTALSRKKDIAQHKLLKADTEAAGDDFERKRAWDWTVDESERWDKRVAQKEEARNGVAFQDYSKEAGKVYARQVGMMEKAGFEERKASYEKQKKEAIDRAVQSGGLEIVETETGELIAVDKDGAFYSTADSTQPFDSKPDREAVNRLVDDIKKAEANRLKKRKERGIKDDAGEDVSYINEKNKQFNQKLARFYNKYTGDIRESFERGTAL